MARCEDFPCCGHELGCCPDYDYDESGKQLNMKCICGATVPLSSRSSLCPACLRQEEDGGYGGGGGEDDEQDGDHASALSSCGWGTDEDYPFKPISI